MKVFPRRTQPNTYGCPAPLPYIISSPLAYQVHVPCMLLCQRHLTQHNVAQTPASHAARKRLSKRCTAPPPCVHTPMQCIACIDPAASSPSRHGYDACAFRVSSHATPTPRPSRLTCQKQRNSQPRARALLSPKVRHQPGRLPREAQHHPRKGLDHIEMQNTHTRLRRKGENRFRGLLVFLIVSLPSSLKRAEGKGKKSAIPKASHEKTHFGMATLPSSNIAVILIHFLF